MRVKVFDCRARVPHSHGYDIYETKTKRLSVPVPRQQLRFDLKGKVIWLQIETVDTTNNVIEFRLPQDVTADDLQQAGWSKAHH
ncbi:MAG: hypothetical protein ACM3TU_01630 [Bacillota bacterium]